MTGSLGRPSSLTGTGKGLDLMVDLDQSRQVGAETIREGPSLLTKPPPLGILRLEGEHP